MMPPHDAMTVVHVVEVMPPNDTASYRGEVLPPIDDAMMP